MNLLEIVNRAPVPEPWSEGEKIPWNDPGFSRRMLAEHLSQAHDAASRRGSKIDAHVDWIDRVVLDAHPSRILDLGCGPGLYTSRLAERGHTCLGIDFSPASIEHATGTASSEDLDCAYRLGDIREIGIRRRVRSGDAHLRRVQRLPASRCPSDPGESPAGTQYRWVAAAGGPHRRCHSADRGGWVDVAKCCKRPVLRATTSASGGVILGR